MHLEKQPADSTDWLGVPATVFNDTLGHSFQEDLGGIGIPFDPSSAATALLGELCSTHCVDRQTDISKILYRRTTKILYPIRTFICSRLIQ